MEKKKIAVVEDDENALSRISNLLAKLNLDIDYCKFQSPIDFLNTQYYFDLVILDIDLPEIDGITLSKKITNITDCIIFLTAYTDRIREAFGMKVAGYLLKTMSDEEIFNFLQKIILNSLQKKITLQMKNGPSFDVSINQVYKITIEARQTYIYFRNRYIILRYMSLSSLYELFDENLIYANQSCMVNPQHILRLTKENTIVFDNSTTEHVSRKMIHTFQKRLLEVVMHHD